MVWIVAVSEVSVNCYRGTVLIADRRLLSDEDGQFLCNVVNVDDRIDLDSNEELRQALEALPSLRSGENGHVSTASTSTKNSR